jgi:alkylation response protein AidB-like acyl-CoA dehydrogenase
MDFSLTKEQNRMIAALDEIGKEEFAPKAARWDKTNEYPYENLERLKTMGILGMTIPARFGGRERPLIDAILAIQTVAKYCGVTARLIVETNMGALGCIMAYGTDAQHKLVAHRILVEGDKPAIGMTEPEAGTDLSSLTTRADKKGDCWVIDGKKHWITGGGISKTNLIFVRFFENGQELGIGGILVDKDTRGFTIGKVEKAMGLRGIPEAELLFNQCVVPQNNVVVMGDRKQGLKKLMFGYNAQRVGASAVALGIARGAHELAVQYMLERKAFGQTLSEFQGLQWKIANAEIELSAAHLLIYQAASNALQLSNNVSVPHMHEASMAKAFACDIAIRVVSDSMQMFGASGYSEDLPLERMYRDVRMFKIGGGTTEAQLNVLARFIFNRKEMPRN